MRKLDVDEVLQRHKLAELRRVAWRSLLEDAYKYALPQRNLFSGDWEANVPGSPKMDDVYDSTAIHSVHQ